MCGNLEDVTMHILILRLRKIQPPQQFSFYRLLTLKDLGESKSNFKDSGWVLRMKRLQE